MFRRNLKGKHPVPQSNSSTWIFPFDHDHFDFNINYYVPSFSQNKISVDEILHIFSDFQRTTHNYSAIRNPKIWINILSVFAILSALGAIGYAIYIIYSILEYDYYYNNQWNWLFVYFSIMLVHFIINLIIKSLQKKMVIGYGNIKGVLHNSIQMLNNSYQNKGYNWKLSDCNYIGWLELFPIIQNQIPQIYNQQNQYQNQTYPQNYQNPNQIGQSNLQQPLLNQPYQNYQRPNDPINPSINMAQV